MRPEAPRAMKGELRKVKTHEGWITAFVIAQIGKDPIVRVLIETTKGLIEERRHIRKVRPITY
jgi:hypothetical protein